MLGLLDQAGGVLQSFTLDRTLFSEQHAVAAGIGAERGLPVIGALPIGVKPLEAAERGHTVVTGLDSFLPPKTRFENLPEHFSLAELAARVQESGLAVAPLLMGTARVIEGASPTEQPEALDALGHEYEVAWRAELELFALVGQGEGRALAERSLKSQREFVRELHARGVPLFAASGAASTGIAPGAGLVDELGQWVEAGVPAADALQAATRGTALALGEANERGRIAPGLVADLIVLGSDPLRSIQALEKPEIVLLRGRVLERFELDEQFSALVARQAASRAARNAPLNLPACLLYTSPSPRDQRGSRMPSSA